MLNQEQELAYNNMIEPGNVFLTGAPGVGKSFLLLEYINRQQKLNKSILVTASTGIAAIAVNGATIHRTFKLPIKPLIEPVRYIPDEIINADILIIEEVSLCRVDLFTYIMTVIEHANSRRRSINKEPLKIVLSGDFFQLPPVVTDDDREILEDYYRMPIGHAFAFQSPMWNRMGFRTIELKTVARQNDAEFIKYLMQLRYGNKQCVSYFHAFSNKNEIKNAIMVCGTNRKVAERNSSMLAKVNSKLYTFESEVSGDVKQSDKLVDDTFEVKIGARVMTVINNFDEGYQNGSLGEVIDIGDRDAEIVVQLDNGNTVRVERYTWDIVKYVSVKTDKGIRIKKDIIGTYNHYPLKLAYAVTIHKSQGQTYDAMNLDPYCWDCGQLYVAISRVRSLDNMHLITSIRPNYIQVAPEVVAFYRQGA